MICYAQKLIAQFSCIIHHQVLCAFRKCSLWNFGINLSTVQMKTKWFRTSYFLASKFIKVKITHMKIYQIVWNNFFVANSVRILILYTSWIKSELVIKLCLVKFKILSNKNLSNLMKNVQQKSLQIIHFLSDGSWLSPKRFTK